MPWKGQGGGEGGPWGGGNGQGPWGKGPSGGGNRGPQPPNIEDLIRRGQEAIRKLLPGGGGGAGRVALLIIAAVVFLWGLTGIYRVAPDEVGVVLRFGAYRETTPPGLHYHLPTPIERVETPNVTAINQTDVGLADEGRSGGRQELPEEALMLTGDENIVDINLTVQWYIDRDRVQDYLFNIRNPKQAVKSVSEAAIREIVGRTPIASVLAEGRGKVQTDTQALIQTILDAYGAGISIYKVQLQKASPPGDVIDAFRDVQRALTEKDTLKNKAEAYSNDVVPRAKGEAEQIVQAAEAYKLQIVDQASGDAQRFLSVLTAYNAAKDVTAERLYLETMEQVLKKANKVLIDKAAGGILPYLPLTGPASRPSAADAAPPATSSGRTSR
jgi:membrane protease subunit HflK